MHEALLEIYYKNKVTIFFITHDLEEAIFLGHKVAIMTTRPCKPKKILDVDIPHPRDYGVADVEALPRAHGRDQRCRARGSAEGLRRRREGRLSMAARKRRGSTRSTGEAPSPSSCSSCCGKSDRCPRSGSSGKRSSGCAACWSRVGFKPIYLPWIGAVPGAHRGARRLDARARRPGLLAKLVHELLPRDERVSSPRCSSASRSACCWR